MSLYLFPDQGIDLKTILSCLVCYCIYFPPVEVP